MVTEPCQGYEPLSDLCGPVRATDPLSDLCSCVLTSVAMSGMDPCLISSPTVLQNHPSSVTFRFEETAATGPILAIAVNQKEKMLVS